MIIRGIQVASASHGGTSAIYHDDDNESSRRLSGPGFDSSSACSLEVAEP